MSICKYDDCNLETHEDLDECILHCSKERLDFFRIRLDFYNALKNYIAVNRYGDNEFCNFFGISFPIQDIQSEINYIKLLATLKQIHFDNCHFFTGYLDLENPEFFFQDCYFHEEWTIRNYKLLKNIDDVIYQNCVFFKMVNTYTQDNEWLYKYDHSQFDYTCTFKEDVILYRAIFQLSPFNGNQDNYKQNTFKKLLIEKCEFDVFELYLLNQNDGIIEFKNTYIKYKLKIRSVETGNYEHQQGHKSILKTLKLIDCQVDEGAYLRVGYLDVGEFVLSNLRNPQKSELNIGDCRFNMFSLRDFRNIGRFKLYKINIFGGESGALFQIDNTSIGDTDFQAICLTSFETVRLFDNIFANIRYTNMQWKEILEVGQYHDDGITEIAKKRDTYRVLKNVALANNDQPQALIFYAKEMEYHKNLTIENRCIKSDFKRYYIKDIFCSSECGWMKEGRITDIIILLYNEKTNNFGLSWWLPIKIFLFLSVIFYILMLLTLGLENTIEHWKYFFVFINPAHNVEFIAKGNWPASTYFIDFLFRIIQGLLIYQTIAAFRKFSKKS